MVDVSAPSLAEEGFADGVADASEADGVCVAGAGCHLLEGRVGEAAFAFVQGSCARGLVFVQFQSYFFVLGFLVIVAPAK